jgi:hypothetical protein
VFSLLSNWMLVPLAAGRIRNPLFGVVPPIQFCTRAVASIVMFVLAAVTGILFPTTAPVSGRVHSRHAGFGPRAIGRITAKVPGVNTLSGNSVNVAFEI